MSTVFLRSTRFGGVAVSSMRAALVGAAVCLLAACASQETMEGGLAVQDPYESINRGTHDFNRGADTLILRPIAMGYEAVTPDLFQFLLRNAFSHLALPRDFANHLLQGDLESAGLTLARFGVNTLGGAGGLLDPATEAGLPQQPADFGQTLAVWGFGEGVYYELPFVGPSTVRHGTGRMVDILFAPTTYFGDPFIGAAVAGGEIIDIRAQNADFVDGVLYEAPDSYTATRSAYYQYRRAFVNGGVTIEEAVDFDLDDDDQ